MAVDYEGKIGAALWGWGLETLPGAETARRTEVDRRECLWAASLCGAEYAVPCDHSESTKEARHEPPRTGPRGEGEMGTRADFYVGRGNNAEWVGSIAWDGYPDGISDALRDADSETAFRASVAQMAASRDDFTGPEKGWPWPWATSNTTDYAYAFDDGAVWGSRLGGPWFSAKDPEPNNYEADGPGAEFPDMQARSNVTHGPRSGLIVIRSKAPTP